MLLPFIRSAVVDASPLLNLLALNFGSKTTPDRPDRLLVGDAAGRYLRGRPDNQQRFLLLFDSVHELMTTSHVIGELQGLATSKLKLNGADKRAFWKASIDYLANHNLDEYLIRILDLSRDYTYHELIGIIGPSDSELIHLAKLKGNTLLTDDEGTLFGMALREGVECELVKNLIAE
jgi:hypothetical protein